MHNMTPPSSPLCHSLVLMSALAIAAAQSIVPSNATLPTNANLVAILLNPTDGLPNPIPIPLVPLLNGGLVTFPDNGVDGIIFPASTDSVGNVTSKDVAWVSCDPEDYRGNLGAIDVIQRAIDNKASAIVTYSSTSSFCNYTAAGNTTSPYTFLFSMEHPRQSVALSDLLNDMDDVALRASINLISRLANATNFDGPGNLNPGGPSPSTAVAMIILYSITGIITALFLIIIITGAIRAHRHPERYGPRVVLGRARQSRAKGIARAMLDSIPIVKFGDHENAAAKRAGDVELAEGASVAELHATPEVNGASYATTSDDAGAQTVPRDATHVRDAQHILESSGIGANVAPSASRRPSPTPDDALGCSICTEDFELGEDVRVLPCNHKFHPACIDPWLLNVSGTCPLCRIDLRPPTAENVPEELADSSTVVAVGDSSSSSSGHTPAIDSPRRSSRRLSTILLDPLKRRHMQDASPEERIQALRHYRQRNTAAGSETDSRRRRLLGGRITDALRGRHANAAGEPSNAAPTIADAMRSELRPDEPAAASAFARRPEPGPVVAAAAPVIDVALPPSPGLGDVTVLGSPQAGSAHRVRQ